MASARMRAGLRCGVIVGAALAMAGCPKPIRPPAQTIPEAPAAAPAPQPGVRGATVYQVNPADSEVHILVYRGGTLARLGHNHVVTVTSLEGRIWTHSSLAQSGFDLRFPVADLVVDDPAARAAAGSDFPASVPQRDREGTRRNMLRAETLDAAQYPNITLRSVSIGGTAQQPQVIARITIKDREHDVELAPAVRIDGARLEVSGELTFRQTDFGIKPFTAALGALEVQDQLRVTFKVRADRRN